MRRMTSAIALACILSTACGEDEARPRALEPADLRRVADASELSAIDAETRAALVKARNNQVFHIFVIDDRDARYRRWQGILLLPRTSDLGELRPTRFTYGDRTLIRQWYHQPGGSISLSLLDESDKHFGVFTVDRMGGASLSADLNGDVLVDFVARIDAAETLVLMAAEDAGLIFLNNLLAGIDNECQRSVGSRSVGLGAMGCNSSGVSSGLILSKERLGDKLCQGATPSAAMPRGTEGVMSNPLKAAWDLYSRLPGPLRGGGSLFGQIFWHLVFPPTAGESGYNPETGEWRPLVEDPESGDIRTATDEEIEAMRNAEEEDEDSDAESDGSETGERGGEGETSGGEDDATQPPFGEQPSYSEVMAEVCQRQMEAQRRWEDLHSLLEDSCDNIYLGATRTRPGPNDAPLPEFECRDEDSELSALGLLEDLKRGGTDGCGPLAQPDAEGNCPGRRGVIGGATGRVYFDFLPGTLLVEPCDPRVCDPVQ